MEKLEVYDTSLRDGGQDHRAKINAEQRLNLVRILDRFGVDYIEFKWAVNKEDALLFKEAAGLLKKSRLSAFSSTRKIDNKPEDDELLNLLVDTGVKYAAIFGKTWVPHIKYQLKATTEQNLAAIFDSVNFLKNKDIEVFYDAEHFFDGFKDNKDYALECIEAAVNGGASAIVLCDTNGGCLPHEISKITKELNEYLKKTSKNVKLGIHCHNDSGCAVANTIAALQEGATHIQGTVNGLGERTGNVDLCTFLPNAIYKLGYKLNDNINLERLAQLSKDVEYELRIPRHSNNPYVGEGAFAHNGGIHVDAVLKGASYNHIDPALVGNKSNVALSNNSGCATICAIVEEQLRLKVVKKDKRVGDMLNEVKSMLDKGYNISVLGAEHYLLASKFFGDYKEIFDVKDWMITSMKNKDSICKIWGHVEGQERDALQDVKGGPVDSAYKSIKTMIGDPCLDNIHLVNYGVEITRVGSREEASTVNVYITFRNCNKEWTTVGNNPNILEASIEAIAKGFRYYLLKEQEKKK